MLKFWIEALKKRKKTGSIPIEMINVKKKF